MMRVDEGETRVTTPVATSVVSKVKKTASKPKPKAKKRALKPTAKKVKKAKKVSKPTAKRPSKPKLKKLKVKVEGRISLPKIVNKAQFVRDNPDLSTKELIAKAKVGGAKLTDSYVYNVRGEAKRGRRTTTGPGRLAVPSKAFFVRSLPDLPVKEVIARAKELGVELSESYVYNVRTTENAKAKSSGLARRAAPTPKGPYGSDAPSTSAGPMTVEELFFMVVAEIGVTRAAILLQSTRDTVKSALGRLP
jgi:hypothetical protein